MNSESNFLTHARANIDTASDRDLTEMRNLCDVKLTERRYNRHLVKSYNAFFLKAMDAALAIPDGDKTVQKVELLDMEVPNTSNITQVTLEQVAISPGILMQQAAYGTLCKDLEVRTGRYFRFKDEQVRRRDGNGVCGTTVLHISSVPFKGG